MGIIRILLALAIIRYHIGTPLFDSFLNNNTVVASFFIISGFSISYTLSRKYPFTKRGLKMYYINRIWRIYPLYVVALIGALLITLLIQTKFDLASVSTAFIQLQNGPLIRVIHYVFENMTLCNLWHSWMITPTSIPLIVLPAWTLLVEFWFYLLAPFINRLSNKWLIGLLGLSMVCRYVTFHHVVGTSALPDNQFFPNQLVYFLMGMLSYRWSAGITIKKLVHKIVLLTALSGMILWSPLVTASGPTHWLFLFALALSLPTIQPLDVHFFWIKFLGELSYPLFLFHLPLVWLGLTYLPPQITLSPLWYLVILLICIAFYVLIRPVIKVGNIFERGIL